MTKEEKMAFEYGKTFDITNVPDGYAPAICFDDRMNKLVSNTRTERGHERNQRNMRAWIKGFESR